MSRYSNNETQKLKEGKVVYKSKIYPKIPLKDTDIYIVTQTGDRVDTLAQQFYGDSSLHWIILTANNIHDAPFAFSDGTILRIPKDYLEIVKNFNQ
jgi:hypothetical protein